MLKKTKKSKKLKAKKTAKTKKPKKIKVEKAVLKEKIEKTKISQEKYFEAVGRRKTAVARIRLFTRGEKTLLINKKPFNVYFPTLELQQIAQSSLKKMKSLDRFRVSIIVRGGGLHAQAEAIRHGIARALILFNPDYRKRLRRVGFLTRDPRMRERKKFGLKRARRAPQWQKR